ncbi:hypothetical protein SK128_023686 [Halocaridina rubra]|uniref:HYR domain-containing protein n=1 Tax=Halocaridina rubra TaxID=373956 RepID=A0AAN9AC98_HALRR
MDLNWVITDTTPPIFITCPQDTVLETPFGWGSMWHTITLPDISDNSGVWDLTLYLDGEIQQNSTMLVELFPGNHIVLHVATDPVMNENTCAYNITVMLSDTEPPTPISCPLSRTIESDVPLAVTWVEPVFQDNSGYIDKVESNYESGSLMAWGVHDVVYLAYDNSTNMGTCSFTITLRSLPCSILHPSINGALICHDSYAGRFCVSMCNSKRDFLLPSPELSVPNDYVCSVSGDWYPYNFTYDCLASNNSEPIMSSEYYYQGFCNETSAQESMQNQALTMYNKADVDITMGSNLTANDFYVQCGELITKQDLSN